MAAPVNAARSWLAALVLALPGGLALEGGCATGPKPRHEVGGGNTSFPEGYQVWTHVNPKTIIAADAGEAREIFVVAAADLGVGTTIVKEVYSLEGGQKGRLQHLAVMRRAAVPSRNGWTFLAFDPRTRRAADVNINSCGSCHMARADKDYLFSARADLVP